MAHKVGYALRIGPLGPAQLRVQSFEAQEAISRYYRFDVTVISPIPAELFERLALSRRAVFAMRVAGRKRFVHGIVTRVTVEGGRRVHTGEEFQYRVRVAPRASLLKRRRCSRVFRHLRADQVIGGVLSAVGVDTIWDLERELPELDYVTQYEETDDDLVRRLAAENGLLFYFRQPPPLLDAALDAALEATGELGPLGDLAALAAGFVESELGPNEQIVFTDAARYGSIGARGVDDGVWFRDSGALGDANDERVTEFELTRKLRSTAARFRDYDPERPRTPLEARLSLGEPPDPREELQGLAERAARDPAAVVHTVSSVAGELVADALDGLIEPRDLEVYEHGGRHLFPDWNAGHHEPARILRQHRRDARRARGRASCARVEAGSTFRLEEHAELSGDYVVVSAKHRGGQTFGAASDVTVGHLAEFSAVPANVPYLPKRPPKRVVQSCLTATVVGPSGQDVHVNAHGEIKVRFHWDRRDAGGEDASAWIRTMHAWGGAGWGTQFIPRVGMEVVVVFEAGDPDRPLVLGSLYNVVQPPPFALPREKTRSGIRTRSTPGGDDGNELSFEDEKDNEQIYIRAKRDLETLVEHDRRSSVRGEDRVLVDGDRAVDVRGSFSTHAHKDRRLEVGGDDREIVRGSRNVDVEHDLHDRVGRDRRARVEGADHLENVGESSWLAHSDVSAEVRGSLAAVVGRDDQKRSVALRVEGTTSISGSDVIDIASDREVVLRCGSSSIRITPGGVEIAGGEVTVRGEDARLLLKEGEAKVKTTSRVQLVSDDAIVLKASNASIGLATDASVDGARVLLNSPEQASDTIEVDDPSPTTIELVDQDGDALPYRRYRLILSDGSEQSGYLDKDGKAEVFVSGSGHIVFPDLADAEQA